MTYSTQIVHVGKRRYKLRFTVGVQTFTIDTTSPRTKRVILWYEKNLKNAFTNLGAKYKKKKA